MCELKQMRGIDMSLFNECFYTDDFDQEMIDYVDTLGNFTARCYIGHGYLSTLNERRAM